MTNNEIFFDEIKVMKGFGFIYPERVSIQISNAESLLRKGIVAFTKEHVCQWNEQYSKVVDWMNDNKGKGLLLMGDVGLGKTLIGYKILPFVIHRLYRWVVNPYIANQMTAKQLDEALTRKILVVDEIGKENPINDYGNKRMAVPEIVDMAERKGNLIILTTNLNKEQLEAKYGIRTLDRLREVTKCITFEGESMRG